MNIRIPVFFSPGFIQMIIGTVQENLIFRITFWFLRIPKFITSVTSSSSPYQSGTPYAAHLPSPLLDSSGSMYSAVDVDSLGCLTGCAMF